jgi:hypothetical protein
MGGVLVGWGGCAKGALLLVAVTPPREAEQKFFASFFQKRSSYLLKDKAWMPASAGMTGDFG